MGVWVCEFLSPWLFIVGVKQLLWHLWEAVCPNSSQRWKLRICLVCVWVCPWDVLKGLGDWKRQPIFHLSLQSPIKKNKKKEGETDRQRHTCARTHLRGRLSSHITMFRLLCMLNDFEHNYNRCLNSNKVCISRQFICRFFFHLALSVNQLLFLHVSDYYLTSCW